MPKAKVPGWGQWPIAHLAGKGPSRLHLSHHPRLTGLWLVFPDASPGSGNSYP